MKSTKVNAVILKSIIAICVVITFNSPVCYASDVIDNNIQCKEQCYKDGKEQGHECKRRYSDYKQSDKLTLLTQCYDQQKADTQSCYDSCERHYPIR